MFPNKCLRLSNSILLNPTQSLYLEDRVQSLRPPPAGEHSANDMEVHAVGNLNFGPMTQPGASQVEDPRAGTVLVLGSWRWADSTRRKRNSVFICKTLC
jgi:hypothetical protein